MSQPITLMAMPFLAKYAQHIVRVNYSLAIRPLAIMNIPQRSQFLFILVNLEFLLGLRGELVQEAFFLLGDPLLAVRDRADAIFIQL